MSETTEHPKQETAATPAHAPSAAQTLFVGGGPGGDKKLETGPVSAWGQWAYDHKPNFARGTLPWYGLRNVVNNMVGIMGLMVTIVPTRMAMGKMAQWGERRGWNTFSHAMSHTVLQNTLGVGVSFATFRTIYKMGQRAYDRVFTESESPQESTRELKALPGNIWKDFKQVAPVEYPATMTASIALVGVRNAFNGGKPPEIAANHWKDVTGCALFAYPAFFEITEQMGGAFQKRRGYNDLWTNEHLNKDKQTPLSFITRQVPGIAAGILPYIGFNNVAYRYTGRQLSYSTGQRANGITRIDSFGPAFWKERPYQLFWMYSLGRDLYFDAYDKVTGYDYKTGTYGHKHTAAEGGERGPREDKPANKIALAQSQGVAAEAAAKPAIS